MPADPELPIIQHVYDLILWYVPRLNKFPRDYKRVGWVEGEVLVERISRKAEELARQCALAAEGIAAERVWPGSPDAGPGRECILRRRVKRRINR